MSWNQRCDALHPEVEIWRRENVELIRRNATEVEQSQQNNMYAEFARENNALEEFHRERDLTQPERRRAAEYLVAEHSLNKSKALAEAQLSWSSGYRLAPTTKRIYEKIVVALNALVEKHPALGYLDVQTPAAAYGRYVNSRARLKTS